MSETDPMNVNERRKYLHKMWGRYRKAGKQEKTRLLDEMEAVTGLHRKSILRTINGQLSRKSAGGSVAGRTGWTLMTPPV